MAAGETEFQQALLRKARRMAERLIVSPPGEETGPTQQNKLALNFLEKSDQLGDADTLVRLLEQYGNSLRQSSHAPTLDRFFRAALARPDLSNPRRVNLASLHALLLIGRGELDAAEAVLARAWPAADTPLLQAELHNRLGVLQEVWGDFDTSRASYEQALVLAQAHGHLELTTRIYNNLGNLAYVQDLYEEALARYHEALAVAESISDLSNSAMAEGGLAMTLAELKRYDEALHYHQVARRHFEQVGHEEGIGRTDLNMSFLHIERGNAHEAKAFASRALMQARELGDVEREATALHNLGRAYGLEADYESAYLHLERALTMRRWMGMPVYILATEAALAQLIQLLEADAQTEPTARARLLTAARRLLGAAE